MPASGDSLAFGSPSVRICFDLESDAIMPGGFHFADPDVHRAAYRRQHAGGGIEFRCGVLFDEARGEFEEFGPDQLAAFVGRLAQADALISQNGIAHDLTLLETVLPSDATTLLRRKPHADLMHIDRARLPELAARHIPDRLPLLNDQADARRQRADELWPPVQLFRGYEQRPAENHLEHFLAKCRLDVECTYLIFRKIEAEQPDRIRWIRDA